VGFQIYQETGLTPAPAIRTAAVINHGFPSRTGKKTDDDKENQFMAAAAAAATAAAGVHPQEDEEPMAVDFVNILPVS